MAFWSRPFLILGIALLGAFFACQSPSSDTMSEKTDFRTDLHSWARPQEVAVTHLSLHLSADFSQHILQGYADLTLDNKTDAPSLWLDCKGLDIKGVQLNLTPLDPGTFVIHPGDSIKGDALEVRIKPDTKKVRIFYATSPEAEALQWLTPEQTAGKKHPFLYTQGQAILTRSWVPIQDSPGMRFTYDAEIRTPKELMALMSATNDTTLHEDGVYRFQQEKPIPAYLMALAIGDLAFQPLGERTGVYAEPASLASAAYEFAEMEKMLLAAEELYGAYRWGRYDVLLLPPSFPFGGMENPCLTFATPTILAGDRSLTSLIAHELAHSWSGNLVTNHTWNDFWLNEGFTVYFERRIMEKIYGKPFADMAKVLGGQDVRHTVEQLGATSPDTRLYLDLTGRNPDDGVTDIAYEKGFFLLLSLENAVGREAFDAWLRGYFDAHAFRTMTTEDFKAYLKSTLLKDRPELYTQIGIDSWIHQPGLPANMPVVKAEAFEAVDAYREAWLQNPGTQAPQGWSSAEHLHFLRGLAGKVNPSLMEKLDAQFGYTKTGNSEVAFEWFMRAVETDYAPAQSAMEAFLIRTGRRKFLTPLYKALKAKPGGLARAQGIYAQARPNYHFVTRNTMDELLGKGSN